jgi:hypothetical protein
MTHMALILLQGTENLLPWQAKMHGFLTGSSMVTLGTWLAAGLTLFMFSFIYKDNPLFRFGEHLYLGVSAGYGASMYWFSYIKPKLIYPLVPVLDPHFGTPEGTLFDPWIIIPAILGAFILLRLIPGWGWLSRITFAFVIGGGTGIGLPLVVSNLFLPQFSATIQEIPWKYAPVPDASLGASMAAYGVPLLNSLILFFGALTVLVYFFFSVEHRGFIGGVSKVGIYFLMIAFGASFGYTIMARVSLLIGRIQFLMFDWVNLEIVQRFAAIFRGG